MFSFGFVLCFGITKKCLIIYIQIVISPNPSQQINVVLFATIPNQKQNLYEFPFKTKTYDMYRCVITQCTMHTFCIVLRQQSTRRLIHYYYYCHLKFEKRLSKVQ